MRILLVEDDTLLAQILVEHLTAQHYVVDLATDGIAGFDYAQAAAYDLIVLDINLPKLNGIQLCQMLRQNRYTMPILLLTARGDSSDKVMGLDAGADDYVVKPCTVEEISARIRALLRRLSMEGSPVLTWGNLCLNPVTCEVTCNDQPLNLSPKEYSLLELLLRNPQRIFNSSSILEHLWSFEDAPTEETIRSHIKRLRRKIKASGNEDIIETVYGMGYRLKPPSFPASDCSSPSSSTSPEEARAAAIAAWEKFQQPVLERVALLDRAVAALEAGHLPDEIRQDAAHAAHKLAGSLALFGFSAGTQIGRDLEQILQSSHDLTVLSIKPLVEQLHHVLQNPASTAGDELATLYLLEDDLVQPQKAAILQQPSCCSALPHVLIVDEDAASIQQLEITGQEQGMQISTASTLVAAQLILATKRLDAVLLDLTFQGCSETGLAFLEELKKQFPTLPVIVFTDQDSFSNRLAGLRRGCDRFISKTTPLNEVWVMVQAVANHESIKPMKVLAVDDDLLVLRTLSWCLSSVGIQVETLNMPETVWDMLETFRPDLVILDVEMPAVSGLELCRMIRSDRTWSNLPILFLTAQQDPEAVLEIYRAGADDYVSKPFTQAEVVTRIFNRLARTCPSINRSFKHPFKQQDSSSKNVLV